MSRTAQRNGATSKRLAEDGDICPVCKSSRYLNPNMRFLVNPECYHKMCESCVDRIFSHGPAPCPIAGCRRTLRKARFRTQTFEDIQVEREVDIRRRVAKVFNKREDDFMTLKNYNDYLEQIETITWNLINREDVEETERKMAAYAEENRKEIARNESTAIQEALSRKAREAEELELAQMKREDARQEDEVERRRKADARKGVVNTQAKSGDDAASIAREGQKVVLKKSLARRAALEKQRDSDPFSSGTENGEASSGFTFTGLKKRVAPPPEKPYDPFGGWSVQREYFVLQNHYDWDWLSQARTNVAHTTGGYDVNDYCTRALCDAFSGFGVFIEDEMAGKNVGSTPSIATAAATVVAGGKADMHMDDVF
ncbi:CDK-activating kinase assembly factor [Lepidopterella palustris CBS 459.81]|uniref:RNA polymerase II transcription factor B subunit 3 n=1 Tax=Lepidopterella palustris CBS 459.81 TaxID=1314670 RepID=A0A8E2JDP5_9PEZI|nr:CDK-activating kinase assembly factor [Lepidopterella palustris CBS 459.81]